MNRLNLAEPARAIDGAAIQALTSFPQDRAWIDAIPGERLAMHIGGEHTKGRFSMLESRAAPGMGTPLHYHGEDELFQILEGVVTFTCGGRTFDAPAGSTVIVPAGAHHAWCNGSAAPVRMLVIFWPSGPETFLTRLGGLSPDEVVSLAAEYGTYVVGPGFAGADT